MRHLGPIAVLVWLLVLSQPATARAQSCRRLPPVNSDELCGVVLAQFADPNGDEQSVPRFPVSEADSELSLDGERRGEGSNERLIDRVTDPISWLMDFRFRDLAVLPLSDSDQESNTLDFRTQMPLRLWEQVNLLRVDVPYDISSSKGSGLGDVVMFDLVVFHAPWGRWGVGPGVRVTPSANEDTFLAGPVAGTTYKDEHWTVGILSENYLSGDNSLSELQPILAYKFNESFAVGVGEMKFKYAWNKGAWTQLPLGMEAKYIADVWGQKIDFFINPQYNFRNSSGDPEWQFYFGITLLVPEA